MLKTSQKLGGDPEIFGEGPFLVDPRGFAAKAGLTSHISEFGVGVLVTGFGPDGFSSDEIEGSASRRNGDGLIDARFKMHFDAAGELVENSDVLKLSNFEIGADFAIEASEQIEIESSGDTDGVVVRGDERGDRLHEIRAEKQRVPGAKSITNAGKKIDAGRTVEVADGATEEEDQEMLIFFAAGDDFLEPLKIFPLETDDVDASNIAKLALAHH